ncbi:MAG: HNH endonuclease [Chloroflexi bacterium]|nr:HNH endonuclease [Chloroflexota bacterium]
MVDADKFRYELRRSFEHAHAEGKDHVDILAKDLHAKVWGSPPEKNQMPNCCQVMRAMMKADDIVLKSPPKGAGSSLLIRYVLPREKWS